MDRERSAWMKVLSRRRQWTALLVLALMITLALGCYGSFPLTRAVYHINGAMPTGVLRTVAFWLFVIVPVYDIAVVADVVVLNLIEFWSGTPFDFAAATDELGNTIVFEPCEDGRRATLTVSRHGEVLERLQFVRVSDTVCEARDESGGLAGKAVVRADGGLELSDASGKVIAAVGASELAVLAAH